MATGQGTATLNFGSYPGSNEASVAVTGQTGILGTSKAEAYFMGDDTATGHTASDHRYAAYLMALTCGTPSVGVGFTIYARSEHKHQGQFQVRFIWAD